MVHEVVNYLISEKKICKVQWGRTRYISYISKYTTHCGSEEANAKDMNQILQN